MCVCRYLEEAALDVSMHGPIAVGGHLPDLALAKARREEMLEEARVRDHLLIVCVRVCFAGLPIVCITLSVCLCL